MGCFGYGWFVALPQFAADAASRPNAGLAVVRRAEPAADTAPDAPPPEAAHLQRTHPEPTSELAPRAHAEEPEQAAAALQQSEPAVPQPDPCDGAMTAALTNARIEFRSASSEILPASRNVMSVLAALAHVCAGDIVIAGHSDNLGPEVVNRQISRERAQAVAAAFAAFGIAPQRLHSSGFGSSRPVADNATQAGRARNRRIEMSFIAEETAKPPE